MHVAQMPPGKLWRVLHLCVNCNHDKFSNSSDTSCSILDLPCLLLQACSPNIPEEPQQEQQQEGDDEQGPPPLI
jgi:hypothetical protein